MNRLLTVIAGLCYASLLMADSSAMTLRNNPFSQPEKKEVVAIQESHEHEHEEQATPATKELRAVVVSNTVPMVNLDGEIIKVGEDIDGFKLLSVKEGEAVFEWQGKPYTLTLGSNDLEEMNEAAMVKK